MSEVLTSELTYDRVYATIGLVERFDDIIDTYQSAFAAVPWSERSQCPSEERQNPQCEDGFSPLGVGMECDSCGMCPTEDAYPQDVLRDRFAALIGSSALWYIEETGQKKTALAVLARPMTPADIASEKYPTNEGMSEWLGNQYQENDEVLWLDEIFADTRIRPSGNLRNFGDMCMKLTRGGDAQSEVAFRTLNPKIISAAQRDFGDQCKIFDPVFEEVPDRRKFVRINVE